MRMKPDIKGQAFVQDLIIAMVIMSIVVILYFGFYTNQDTSSDSIQQSLLSETKTITDYLVSEGFPTDWNSSNVVRLGVTSDGNVINMTKLDAFSNMTITNYDNTRTLLKTKYDYIIFFRDYEGNIMNITSQIFIGKPGINITNLDSLESPTQLSKVSRFVVLREGEVNTTARIIEMVTYAWTDKR